MLLPLVDAKVGLERVIPKRFGNGIVVIRERALSFVNPILLVPSKPYISEYDRASLGTGTGGET